MRKWMADRLKRRKKVTKQAAAEPAPTPLQPAYFDADAVSPAPAAEVEHAGPPEPQAAAPAPEQSTETPRQQSGQQPGQKRFENDPRRRRRRGGRGRGRASQPKSNAAPQAAPSAAPAVTPVAAKGTVILAIGLPGSGKSSWFKRNNISPLSSDMLRTLLFDDATEQRFQDLVFSNLRSMLKARLLARRPMNYVDATNLTPQERHSWIKLGKDFGYEVQALYFDVPVEVCLERNQRRERVVDEAVMRRMAAKLQAPTFAEGFSKITVVKVKKKDNKAEEPVEAQ